MKKLSFILVLLSACLISQAEGRLFHITRVKNANIIAYDVNLKGNKLDIDKPVHPYWVRYAEDPVTTAELTVIQRKLAFGYKVIRKGDNEVEIKLTAYNGRSIRVCFYKNKWVGMVEINGKESILNRIHVQTKPHNSMSVMFIELHGTSPTGESVMERIYNK